MIKKLVAYFSVSGVTEKAAQKLAKVEDADLFAIRPAEDYTAADLDWTNKKSRSTLEMSDLNCRPEMKENVSLEDYDAVFVGFPIWWGREPSIVDTFLCSNDFTGKTVIPFCTSGGSGVEAAVSRIRTLVKGTVEEGKRLGGDIQEEDLEVWTKGLSL